MLLSLWDLSFLTRDWTQDLEVKALSNNNHWATGESSLSSHCLSFFFFLFLWLDNCKYLVVTFPDLFIYLFIFCLVGSAVECFYKIFHSVIVSFRPQIPVWFFFILTFFYSHFVHALFSGAHWSSLWSLFCIPWGNSHIFVSSVFVSVSLCCSLHWAMLPCFVVCGVTWCWDPPHTVWKNSRLSRFLWTDHVQGKISPVCPEWDLVGLSNLEWGAFASLPWLIKLADLGAQIF